MYNIDINKVKRGKGFYIVFLIGGLFFFIIIGGILVSNFIALSSLDSTTMSTKVSISSYDDEDGTTMYRPAYYYSVNGSDYICDSTWSSNINPGTDNKTVYYDSKNPKNCMTEYSKSSSWWISIFLIIPTIFIIFALVNIGKENKRVSLIKKLNQKGKLVKNIPYRLEDTGIVDDGVSIQGPVIEYTLPSGETVTLRGDPEPDKQSSDGNGTVDLVIDEDNPKNYFIDFEIDRLSGNLPTDYYNNPDSDSEDTTYNSL